MTTRYEGCDTTANVDLLEPLSKVGEEELDPGVYAISIAYDEVFYITGTPADLRGFAMEVLGAADAAVALAQKPLTLRDFANTEDGFQCPRCEAGLFENGEFDDVNALLTAVSKHIATHEPTEPKEE